MSPTSERRETTLKDSDAAAAPRTKRDSFHCPKYSLIVGTITTSDVIASDGVGSHAFADASSSFAYLSNACRRREQERRRRAAPRRSRSLPSPSRSTGVLATSSSRSGSVPQSAPSVRL